MEAHNFNHLIKQTGCLKKDPTICYKMYLLDCCPKNHFSNLVQNLNLNKSLIELSKLQYTDQILQDNNINESNILQFYTFYFNKYNYTKIVLNIAKNKNEELEIGSIAIITKESDTTLKIYNVFTMPSYRENGLCSIMIGILLDNCYNELNYELLDQQILNITLDVLFDNVPAISCYEKYGFELIQKSFLDRYCIMDLNFRKYFLNKIKSKILKLSSQLIKDQILKNQINILLTKI